MKRTPYAAACGTAKGRAACLAAVVALAAKHRVALHTEGNCYMPRDLYVTLSIGEYRVSIDFDGESHVGAFLAHWYTGTRSAATYPADFPFATVNQHHYGKATQCAETFDEFVSMLDAGLGRIAALLAESVS